MDDLKLENVQQINDLNFELDHIDNQDAVSNADSGSLLENIESTPDPTQDLTEINDLSHKLLEGLTDLFAAAKKFDNFNQYKITFPFIKKLYFYVLGISLLILFTDDYDIMSCGLAGTTLYGVKRILDKYNNLAHKKFYYLTILSPLGMFFFFSNSFELALYISICTSCYFTIYFHLREIELVHGETFMVVKTGLEVLMFPTLFHKITAAVLVLLAVGLVQLTKGSLVISERLGVLVEKLLSFEFNNDPTRFSGDLNALLTNVKKDQLAKRESQVTKDPIDDKLQERKLISQKSIVEQTQDLNFNKKNDHQVKKSRLMFQQITNDLIKMNRKKTENSGEMPLGLNKKFMFKNLVNTAMHQSKDKVEEPKKEVAPVVEVKKPARRGLKRLESTTQNEIKQSIGEQVQYLEKFEIFEWDFNPFMYNQGSSTTIYSFMFNVFQKFDFFELSGLSPTDTVLEEFCAKVQKTYLQNPFHNYLHALDVTNTTAVFILKFFGKILLPIDKFSLMISSLVHDLGHPGVQNNFLVTFQHKYAVKYNDQSVLENMHISKFFKINGVEATNITKNMSQQNFRLFRKQVITIILNTDLAKHIPVYNEFQALSKTLDLEKPEQKLSLMCIIEKASDISHGAKDQYLHKIWSKLILEEFQRQGQLEAKYNLPMNKFADRNQFLPDMQIRFLSHIVMPTFKMLDEYYQKIETTSRPIKNQKFDFATENITKNTLYWEQQKKAANTNETLPFVKEMNFTYAAQQETIIEEDHKEIIEEKEEDNEKE